MRDPRQAWRSGFPLLLALLAMGPSAIPARAWQQRCDYRIRAAFDPPGRWIVGAESLTYHNQSPDTLRALKFHLYHEAVRPGSAMDSAFQAGEDWQLARLPRDQWGGCRVDSARLGQDAVEFHARGTIGWLELPRGLAPGDSLCVELHFRDRLPGLPIHSGAVQGGYFVGEWYPSVCAYDARGWHATEYLGRGEFFADFGNFDVEFTLPASYLLAHTGTLTNGADVLPEEARLRLEGVGPRVVRVLSGSPSPDSLRESVLTWKLHAGDVHDFALAASRRWAWDAVRRGGVTVSVFHSQAAGGEWDSVPGAACRYWSALSERIGPLPDSTLVVAEAAGLPSSIEKPGMVWIAPPPRRGGRSRRLWQVVAHEIAHQWFYGRVADDEAAEAWLDEGFATYLALGEMEREFGGGENRFQWTAPLDSRWLNPDGFSGSLQRELADWEAGGRITPVLTTADDFPSEASYVHAVYQRGALLLLDLEHRLGRAGMDSLLAEYYGAWNGRHPSTGDFEAVAAARCPLPPGYFDRWLRGTGPSAALAAPTAAGGEGARGDGTAALAVRVDNGIAPFDERRADRATLFVRPSLAFNDVDGPGAGVQGRVVSGSGAQELRALLRLPSGLSNSGYRPWIDVEAARRLRRSGLDGALEARVAQGEGRQLLRARADAALSPREGRTPAWDVGVGLERWRLDHPGYLREVSGWTPGRETVGFGRIGVRDAARLGRVRADATLRVGEQGGARFTRGEGVLGGTFRGPAGRPLSVRLGWGGMSHSGGAPPAQELFRLGGAGPLEEFENPLLRSRGVLGPSAHARLDGDAGVRAMSEDPAMGQGYLAASVKLDGPEILQLGGNADGLFPAGPLLRLRSYAFWDAGGLSGVDPRISGARSAMDAGPGMAVSTAAWNLAASIDLPVWANPAPAGEPALHLRWRLTLGAAF